MTSPRALIRPFLAVIATLAASLALAPAASAHTELRSTQPEQGAIVESLDEVRLEFTGDVLEIGTELTLVDGDGTEQVLDPAYPSTNVVTGAVAEPMATGAAQLQWRIVAEDGHPIEGVVDFEFIPLEPTEAPAPTTEPEPTVAPTPSVTASETAEPSPSPTASATAEPVAEPESGGMPVWGWILIAVALVASAGTAIAVAMRRNRE